MKEIGNSLETLCVKGHRAPPQEGNSVHGANTCEHSKVTLRDPEKEPCWKQTPWGRRADQQHGEYQGSHQPGQGHSRKMRGL